MDVSGSGPGARLVGAIDPIAVERAPALVDIVERDAALQDDLVRAAHDRLGTPGASPRGAWLELARGKAIETALGDGTSLTDDGRKLLQRNAHAISVELGTIVVLPESPFDPDFWTVVGAGRSDRLELARRLPDGTLQRQARRWPELVLANPTLAEKHMIPPASPKAMPSMLRELAPPLDAPAAAWEAWDGARSTVPPARREFEQVSTLKLADDAPPLVLRSGTWEELAQELKVTRLRPIPLQADDAWAAAFHVEAAGPRPDSFVMAAESDLLLGRQLLVGTDALPLSHRATKDAAELERISAWYDELGLRTWRGARDQLVLTTGLADSIGNASAHGNADYSLVNLGFRDHVARETVLGELPRETRVALRSSDDMIRRNFTAVLGHEAGHVAVQQVWGVDASVRAAVAREAGDVAAYAAVAEHGVASEAFSDLLGASYARTRDIGVRDLGRLANGFGDLDQLRATILRTGAEHSGHTGTQLITKPMLLVQQRRGWDAVAQVTASATKRLGAMLARGEIDAVDVPSAARALRDSAAMRWGADDDLVRSLTAAWTKLRVLA